MKLNIDELVDVTCLIKDFESFAMFRNEAFVVALHDETSKATRAYVSIHDETEMVDEGLSHAAIRTYKYFYEVSNSKKIPTTEGIAECLRLAPRTVQKACKSLVDAGYMYDRRFTAKRHTSCIRFLGKDIVRNARLKAAVIGLMMDRKLDGNQMAEWVSTNKEDYLKALTGTNELSIYFKD